MWIFTSTGFVSAVQYKGKTDTLVVRARDRESLESLALEADKDIITAQGTDYFYRVIVSRSVFETWMSNQLQNLDYGNFKDEVYITRGKDFAHALGEVWSVMLQVEDDECKSYYNQRYNSYLKKAAK